MRLNRKKPAGNLCLLAFAMLCTALANAQLSTSVSQQLDTNLNGLDSAVAPIPSTQVEPGANNLLTPDEHVLPYDSIGASILSTPLNPSITQYFGLSRGRSQLDGTVKDATMMTGQHPTLTMNNIVDVIGRRSGTWVFSSLMRPAASSFGSSSIIPPGLPADANRIQSGTVNQQTSWRAGSSPAALAINPAQPSLPTTEPDEQTSTSNSNNAALLKKKPKSQDKKDDSDSSVTERSQDYSKSPLEATAKSNDSVDIAPSPFGRLDQESFLSPDISRPVHHGATKGAKTSLNARTQSDLLQPRTTRTMRDQGARRDQGTMRDQGMSRAESRLMRQSSGIEKAKKPKWHNPILQQMQNESNLGRQ